MTAAKPATNLKEKPAAARENIAADAGGSSS
jgi:hypothetical protein